MSKQKIKKLIIGTNNKGKLREIRSLLPKNIKIYSTSGFNFRSPVENGKTFEENSFIKSKYFSKKTGLICLSDDSGLEIDILDKRPGIYSARWGGKNSDFRKAIKKMNSIIEGKSKKEALDFLPKFNSELMKIAKTGIIKKQNASRNISKITKKINNL